MRIIKYQRATYSSPGHLRVQCGDRIYAASHDIRSAWAERYSNDHQMEQRLSDMAYRAMRENITAAIWKDALEGSA